jgi:nucleoside-diphosphate-sugar epimerase
MEKKVIAITGATGFIGEELTRFFLQQDFKVIGLARRNIEIQHSNFTFCEYHLETSSSFDCIVSADVVIHCAFIPWSPEKPNSSELNCKATMALAEFCETHHKKFVFLSSFSAHEHANSHYGKHKFFLEEKLKNQHLVIKPGLVTGARGLYSRLSRIVAEKKIVPVIGNGDYPLQWIGVDELCKGIQLALAKNLTGVFPLASVEIFTYLQVLERLALKQNRQPIFVFIPVFFAALLLKLFGNKLPFSEENLKGLLQLRKFETAESIAKVGITIRDL